MSSNVVDIVIKATDQFSSVFNLIRTNAESSANSITSSFQRAGNNMTSIGKTMSTAISLPIAGIGAAALKAGMDFEAGMSSIKALTGASSEEMVKLHDLALKMGQDTKYSATEAAKGLEELLKAGMSTEQVMNGGLNAALSLATAGELELADAAEIMSTAMNAFKADGMSAGDAANILAGCANASATSVGELKFSLAACAAVASSVGVSFADTNATLGVFAQNGLKGSDAGTSLKTMLMNLQPHSKAATVAMEQLGIITADGANQFFTAEGKLKSMAEVAGVLKTSMAGLTDQQRLQVMQTMFGSDAIRAANILYKEGADGINNMKAEMSKVTAEEVAKEKMNNLKGSLEQLKGTLETTGIKMYESKAGPLKALADGVQKAVEAFNNLPPGMQSTIVTIGLFVAAVGPVLMIVGSLISNIQICIGAFSAVSGIISGAGGAIALLSNPIGIAIAAIAAMVAIGVVLYKNWDTIKEYAGRIWEAIKIIVQVACDNISYIIQNWTLPGMIYKHWDDIKAATSATWEGIKSFLIACWDGLVSFITNWTLPGLIYKHWDDITAATSNAWNSITQFLSDCWNGIVETATSIWTSISDFFSQNTEQISQTIQNVWNTILQFYTDIWNTILQTATEVWTAISDFFYQNLEGMYQTVQDVWNNITQFYVDCWNNISTTLTEWVNSFVETLTGGWEAISTNVQEYWNNIVNWLTETWNNIQGTVNSWCDNVVNLFNFTWEDVYNGIVNYWNSIGQWLSDCWNNIYNKAVDVWNRICAVMSGQSGAATEASMGDFRNMEEENVASMIRTNAGVEQLSTQQAQTISNNAVQASNASRAAQLGIEAATKAHHTAMYDDEKQHQAEVKATVTQAQQEALAALKQHQDSEKTALTAAQQQERADLKQHQQQEQDALRANLAAQKGMSTAAKEQARIELKQHQDAEKSELLKHQQETEAGLKVHLENERVKVETHNRDLKASSKQNMDEMSQDTLDNYAQMESATLKTYENIKTTVQTKMDQTKSAFNTNLESIKSIQTTTLGQINSDAQVSFDQLKKIMTDPVGSAKDMVASYLKQILQNVLDFKWPSFPALNIPVNVSRGGSRGGSGIWGTVAGLVAGNIFRFAKGGAYPGGVALVGEEGPELINFNRGGYVHTAGETASILRGGNGSGSGITIREVNITANSEAEGRNAAIGFISEMQKYGFKTRGV